MKIIKYSLLTLLGVTVLGLAMLLIWRPVLLKVLRYRTPDAETYKIFPQAYVQPSDSAFHFIRPAKQRNDLDTLQVFDGQQHYLPLKDYLKAGQVNLFMVIRNDSILYEKYDKGYSDSTLATTFSIAKSMLSVLVGQALADGRIKSLDDPILNYIPELSANSAYSTLILRDLFTMKSGLAFRDTNGGIINAFFSDEAKYYYTDDMKRELLKVKRVGYPGQAWQYKSIDAILLGWVVEKATKKSLAQYFQERLWQRIGTQYRASWGLDHVKGLTNTASRFQVTAIDLAKVGRLYLNDGQYNGQQVVPQDWVLQTIKMQGSTPVTSKGWQKTTQNYLWWLPQEGVNGEYAAEGMLGQRLYVDPLTKTIIVVFADKGGGDYPYRKVSRYLAGMPFSYPKILN